MKCTISDCNAPHRTFIRLPGQDKPKPFCGPHTLEMRSRFSQSTPESETLAPVIDIKTRERIASWSERYAKQSSKHVINWKARYAADKNTRKWIPWEPLSSIDWNEWSSHKLPTVPQGKKAVSYTHLTLPTKRIV